MRRRPIMRLRHGCMLAAFACFHAAAMAAEHIVVIEATSYSPATLEVGVGDTVVWQNKDPFPHTVTSAHFDSGKLPADGRWTFKVKKRGTYPYVCTLHPTMKGTLIVK